MARPQKNTVDYFPFYCEDGKKMYYLEETYGNDGFATFVKILRELAKVDYHFIDLSKKSSMMFLSAKCKVSIETLESIISDLVMLEKFDSILWNDNKIIWCQSFVDSIQDAYLKRSNDCITYNGLLLHLDSLGVRKLNKSKKKPSKSISEGIGKPQTILNKTKEDESIEDEKQKNNTFSFRKSLIDLGVEEKVAEDFMKVRKKKKATDSETAFNLLHGQIEKSGKSANECILICIERDWKSFNHSWVSQSSSTKNSDGSPKFQNVIT